MRTQPQVLFGLLIIGLGVIFLLGSVFNFNVGAYCWPIGLIALGVVVLIRPRTLGPNAESTAIVLGDIKRDETWKVSNEEFWAGICGLKLDLSRAEIPIGETHLRLISFIGDIDLRLPQEVGIHITANAFISDVKLFGRKQNSFFLPNDVISDNYAAAERKIRLDTGCFIADIDIKRG